MPRFLDHFTGQPDSRSFGVILANLGTPESPDTSSVRRFLRQFLSDPRVVELPKPLWWLILNGVILVIRPSRSAAAYRKVWTEDGSPLMVNAKAQIEALEKTLRQQGINCAQVRCAMRYGEPSLMQVMQEFGALGIDRIVVIPMYPQYSGSTTGSVVDDVYACSSRLRRVPSIRFINGYADHDQYIESLRNSVKEHWERNGQADCLVMSFHGLPQSFCDNGDPYYDQCLTTARLLAQKLALESERWTVCFQSRVGRQEWLKPYVDEVISKLPDQGVGSIDMLCPGFSVDCLETLEEVNIGYRELFLNAGGNRFEYIPCLNDQPAHMELLVQILRSSATDWIGQ